MGKRNLLFVHIIICIINFSVFILAPIFPIYLKNHLGYLVVTIGVVFSINSVFRILGTLFIGPVYNVLGYKKMIILGIALRLLTVFPIAFLKNPIILSILYGCMGLGFSFVSTSVQSYIVSLGEKKIRQKNIAANSMASNIGASLGVLIGGLLIKQNEYTLGFFMAGILTVLLLLLSIFFKTNVKVIKKEIINKELITHLSSIIKNKEIIKLFSLVFLYWIIYKAFMISFPIFINETKPDINVGFLFLVNSVIIIMLQIIYSSYSNKRFSVYQIILFGFIFIGTSFVLLFFSNSYFLMIISIVIFTFGEMSVSPSLLSHVGSISSPQLIVYVMSFQYLVRYIGDGIGSLLNGFLSDYNIEKYGDLRINWIVMAVFTIIPIICSILFISRNKVSIRTVNEEN